MHDIDAGVDGTSVKARRMREWSQKWEDFCEWIVEEYGERYNVSSPAP